MTKDYRETACNSWERHIPPGSIKIGGIPFELSYRLWSKPELVRRLDHINQVARSRSPDAPGHMDLWVRTVDQLLKNIWVECAQGSFYVSGIKCTEAEHSRREFISLETINTFWPIGEKFRRPDMVPGPYIDLEITGPAPAWAKLTL